MNREDLKKMLPLMQAYADGAVIQYKCDGEWADAINPQFYCEYEYRIKPEPREIWVNVYESGYMGNIYSTKLEAQNACGSIGRSICFREVIE